MTADLLLSFYGDDFTGSTDVMEALSSQGIETVLFTRRPDPALLARFGHCRAVGLAGSSRSQSPEWMDAELPDVFAWLKTLDARHCHYKVCSTFDSAPHRGSIGRAIELGLAAFGQHRAHLVVGAPQLRRYTFAGHLFATYRDEMFRIDRHPVMSRHPATPMGEADLLLHLAAQTDLATALVGSADPALARAVPEDARIVLVDVFDARSQHAAGILLENRRAETGPFVAGSSGVEYALLEAWRAEGLIAKTPPDHELPLALPRIAVVSGSCSPTTARQIQHAARDGFTPIRIDYRALASGEGHEAAYDGALAAASSALEAGHSPLVHTALGPEGDNTSANQGGDARVGAALGRLISQLHKSHDLPRLVIAGGDTSSHALGALDIHALTMRYPIADSPGSPLCTAHGPGGTRIELALKGGQIGTDDYFSRLRDGTLSAA